MRVVASPTALDPLSPRPRGSMIGEFLALAGATFVFLAAIGVVRFPDALSRMHALSKASTLGVLLILIGAAV